MQLERMNASLPIRSQSGSTTVEAATEAISLDNIVHRYGDRAALDGVSFTVEESQIFGLLGPNGSGKTTLFRILSTLISPSNGDARICGWSVTANAREVRKHIGVVFQEKSVDVKLTAAENLMHQGHLYGLRGAALKARIAQMLDRVGLSDRANDKVETFSGGMLRRVEIAKGLMHRPAVLLLDEPTTGLDPGARIDLWQYLRILREEEGITVLVTTHLMEEAERCDRLAILAEGKVAGLGSPAELKNAIGGDVVVFDVADPEAMIHKLQQRFQLRATVMAGRLRLNHDSGHRFAAEVAEAFPGEILSASVAKPSLEDVFIERTGHRFWTEKN
jgi:ABC-2 type transport system ATP-binding protein